MSAEAAAIPDESDAEATPKAAGKIRLLTLADLDRRTAAYQKTRKLIAGIEGDLGGADRLSTGERQLAQRSAVLGAMATDMEGRWIAGEPVDPAAYATLVNCQRRTLESIGLRRRPKDVQSLEAYLASKSAEAS